MPTSSKPKVKTKTKTTPSRPRTKKIMEPTQTTIIQKSPNQRHAKLWIILGAILVVIVVAGAYTYFHYKGLQNSLNKQQETPLERLKRLEESSAPVTATPQERTAELKTLEKSSKPVTTSQQDRLTKLQQLEASSKQ